MPWFEDVTIGDFHDLGDYLFVAEEMIAFARQFDPQPHHIDPIAAQRSPYGGLVASGWFVTAIWMKRATATRAALASPEDPGAGPSPGFLDMRWPHPVRPGDRIRFTLTVTEGFNQRGEPVLRFTGQGLAFRRTPVPGGSAP